MLVLDHIFLDFWVKKQNEKSILYQIKLLFWYWSKCILDIIILYIKTDNTIYLIILYFTALYCVGYSGDDGSFTALRCTGLCLKEGGHNTWQFSEIVCLDQIINSHQFRVNLADIGDTFKGPQANFNPCYMHWSYYIYRVSSWFIENSLKLLC